MRISVTAGLLLAIGFSLGTGSARAESAASTPSVLAALRRTMLARPIGSLTSIHTTGTIELLGIRGRAQEWNDVRGVRFTVDQNAGPLSGAEGWDGKTAWSQDYAGLVTIDGGMAGRLQAINQAYLDNLRYLRPDAGGATVVYAGRTAGSGGEYDVLAVTPPNGTEIRLWIDPQTHLIARETTTIGAVQSVTTLLDYRHVEGITYPFASTTQLSSGNTISERVSTLEVNADVAERMRVPRQNVHDFAIAGGTTGSVPIRVVNNHVYVSNVTIDGHGPYTFVLDSGGDYIVTPEVAAALSAKSSGTLHLQGVGSATEGASFARIGSVAVGNATVRDQYALVLPIATGFGVAEGMQIDGMLGYQFLARFLTTIDYAGSKLTLSMPSLLPAAAPGAAAMQFFLDGTIPRVNVNVGDVTVSAEVDTGNRAGLELSSPFLAAHPAIAALAKTAPTVTGFGVGGPSYARLGRIPALQIGPYQISNSIALFSTSTEGALADPFNPANIGGALLSRFDCTFDYAHQQLLLSKNAQFDAQFTYDRSGLFLIDQNGTYTVLAVLAGTAAAAAGIAKGDAIVAINGAPATAQALAAVRAVLASPAGT
ncbi:MAG TPA: retropepsin-like aspartic protease, partial [Candidatus Cybelea sp.]